MDIYKEMEKEAMKYLGISNDKVKFSTSFTIKPGELHSIIESTGDKTIRKEHLLQDFNCRCVTSFKDLDIIKKNPLGMSIYHFLKIIKKYLSLKEEFFWYNMPYIARKSLFSKEDIIKFLKVAKIYRKSVNKKVRQYFRKRESQRKRIKKSY